MTLLPMPLPSKTKIDRAGAALAKNKYRSDDEYFELEDVFDEYRKAHLQQGYRTFMS